MTNTDQKYTAICIVFVLMHLAMAYIFIDLVGCKGHLWADKKSVNTQNYQMKNYASPLS